ncbi:Formate/nitrite transporter FocA, FNT family [Halogranum amylolyticum]|uniref:Formate/nitrite transporter FocA, FNT family n=1 Tax=Halogranum amylolyticum TaxID=660520 RepID=A0A1H8NBA2_9EURY|nr:formate/nitrite transporter family protein [Halogranum amylolyticum]SEO26884.1 Formate/nitrite transporter FocA, FNT family [Halogranum amylolyticum]
MATETEENPATQSQAHSHDILDTQIKEGMNELDRESIGLFLSSLSAGLDIGFGPLLIAVVVTVSTGQLSPPLIEILMASAYSLGFLFVILGQTELFTEHTTLAVLPVLDRQASILDLGRLWGLVYGGNIVGGTLFAIFVVPIGISLGVAEPSAFAEVATKLTDHSAFTLFGAGILAGWLMGLLSWLVTASSDTIGTVAVIFIVTGAIGFMHLPHSIAGNVEVLAGLVATNEVTFADYGRFLVTSTAGNAVGGTVFVALLKYGHVVRGGS